MATPETMRAFAIGAIGERGQIRAVPVPVPAEDEIRVRVGWAALNASDWRVRGGSRVGRFEHVFPAILGTDFFGVVESVGSTVDQWTIGQRVHGMAHKSWIGGGVFAEFVTVAQDSAVAPAPRGLSPEGAAAIVSPWLTSHAVLQALDLSEGAIVVVLGASGGIGSLLTQRLARAGAHVVAVTRGTNADYVRSLGATDVIDYTRESVVAAARASYPDGVDIVVDMVNDAAGCAEVAIIVRPGGQLVSAVHAADVESLAAAGIRATNIGTKPTGALLGMLPEVWDRERLVLPQIEIVPFDRAPEALDRVEDGHVRGKLVLAVDPAIV